MTTDRNFFLLTWVRRLLALAGCSRHLQAAAHRFWEASDFNYLGTPEYYDARERILIDRLSSLHGIRDTLDVGCGEGRFSRVLSRFSRQVVATDLSPRLIAMARDATERESITNIRFVVSDIGKSVEPGAFDLVSAMGVTSCIVDDDKYRHAMDSLTSSVAPGKYLLLIDSVSLGRSVTKVTRNGYIARHRSLESYEREVLGKGMVLLSSDLIRDWTRTLTNRMWIFQKPGTSDSRGPDAL